jgi:LysM repeat protein
VGQRRHQHVLLFLVAFGAVTLLGSLEAAAQRTITVRAGDALSVLADRFGVSVEDLARWNELEDDRIQVGQELVVATEGSARDEGGPTTAPTYEVRAGDTLSGIASRLELSLDQLLQWNEGLSADNIRAGQTLVVGPPRHRIEHVVRRGESVSRIAARYEVGVRDVLRWNRRLERRTLQAGAKVVVFADRPESRSESVGLPHAGRLLHAERLPLHRGYVIRERDRAWGTRETNDAIISAFDAVVARHDDTEKVRVHDLSAEGGGRLSDHRSHQNGRDADISYYHRGGCPSDGCGFRRLSPEDLDVERTWTLLSHWLERDQAQAIFIDYSLQPALYREARRRGATNEQLHQWFQYPRGTGYPLGVIRHFRYHRDHFHVRFRCVDDDEECR